MGSWREIAISGSSPDLKSVFLSGTNDGTEYIVNPLYQPTASNMELFSFTGDNNAWKTNEDNLSDYGGQWISEERMVSSGSGQTLHKNFDISGLSPICLPTTIIGNSNIGDGEIYQSSNSTLLMERIQNGTDYNDYFAALAALTSSWGTYTLTDQAGSTVSCTITNVINFQQNNTKLFGASNNGTEIDDLVTGPATICLPPSFTTGSDMVEPLTSGTGPNQGVIPQQLTSNIVNQPQHYEDARYLYAETSDPGENTYSITSPFIDVTDYAAKKLVFFFNLHGDNCGNFKVYTSPSSSSLVDASLMAIKFSNWPGNNGAFPSSEASSLLYWSSGSQNTPPYVYQVGPDEVQKHPDSPFNRVEVDLASFTSGYIWIVYESGNPNIDFVDSPEAPPKADFAIGSLYLDLGGYLIPEQSAVVAETPTLEVKFNHVKFVNLPQSDPEVLGALYKDPSNLTGIRSQIRISNGPL